MTIDDLDALLDFHYWARDRVLDAAAALTPEQFDRDVGGSFKSGQFTDLDGIRRAWTEHEAKVRAFVKAQAIAHMVQHLVNHGTYHRGQVTMMLRLLGVPPPETTDLIRYYHARATARV